MERRGALDQLLRHAIEETWAAVTPDRHAESCPPSCAPERPGPIQCIPLDEGRALGAGACHAPHSSRAGSFSRSLVMACVSADIVLAYSTLRERSKWLPSLVKPWDWDRQHERSANRVLETAASLGGALIKGCQFASTRPDILPAVYIRRLATLQDRMPPRSWAEIEKAIASELHQRPENIFADIEREPVAAASIAQVHRARLKDGRAVAVKVQYPDVETLVASDLTVLEQIVKVIARLALHPPSANPRLPERETPPLELDFRREARSMARLRAAFARRSDVVIPVSFPELSTKRLLVMEYIEGIKINDREALERAGISPHDVARLLNYLYADQMLHLGILHGDPHPGNLLVQPGPRLALLDHGLTVNLPPSLVASLNKLAQALTSGDFDGVYEALKEAGLRLEGEAGHYHPAGLGGSGAGQGPDDVEEDADVVGAGMQFVKSIGGLPADLLMVGRALSLVDGITKQLDPDMNIVELAAQYAETRN